MNVRGFAMKLTVGCALFFAGHFLLPENSSAQACEYSWPTIGDNWRLGPDNYYTFRDVVGEVIVSTCAACACEALDVPGDRCEIDIDGQLTTWLCGGNLPFGFSISTGPGAHSVKVRFTAKGNVSCHEQSYEFSKNFYVDNTPATITLTNPEDGVVISTADLTITGSVVDTESKVGIVTVSLFAAAPCQFHHNLFGIPVASSSISG